MENFVVNFSLTYSMRPPRPNFLHPPLWYSGTNLFFIGTLVPLTLFYGSLLSRSLARAFWLAFSILFSLLSSLFVFHSLHYTGREWEAIGGYGRVPADERGDCGGYLFFLSQPIKPYSVQFDTYGRHNRRL